MHKMKMHLLLVLIICSASAVISEEIDTNSQQRFRAQAPSWITWNNSTIFQSAASKNNYYLIILIERTEFAMLD